MDFIVKYELGKPQKFSVNYCNSIDDVACDNNNIYIEKLKHLDYIELTIRNKSQIAFGDVIGFNSTVVDLKNCKGLFYLLSFTEENRILRIEPDEHGLFPIYFMEQDDCIFISSSYTSLVSQLKNRTPNTDFYSELAILYTQINGSTYFKEISRLGYGEVIELNNGFKIIQTHRFYDNFTDVPKSFRSSLNDIADMFIDVSIAYLNEPCAISLTGGFDGRTLTGCAHYHKSDFINFSYGRRGNGDVDNPITIADQLGLKYKLIELEQELIRTCF